MKAQEIALGKIREEQRTICEQLAVVLEPAATEQRFLNENEQAIYEAGNARLDGLAAAAEALGAEKRAIDQLTSDKTESPVDNSSMWRRRLEVQKSRIRHRDAVIEENERGQQVRELEKHLATMEREQATAFEQLDALRKEQKLLEQLAGTEEDPAAAEARAAARAQAKSHLHVARLGLEKARIRHRDAVIEENERGQRNRELEKHLDAAEVQQAITQRQIQLEHQRMRGKLTDAAVRFADTDNNT